MAGTNKKRERRRRRKKRRRKEEGEKKKEEIDKQHLAERVDVTTDSGKIFFLIMDNIISMNLKT